MRSRWARRLRAAIPSACARPCLVRGLELFEHVAEAAHRADLDSGGLELRAKPRYVDFDGVRREVFAPAGNGLDDRLLGDDLLHFSEQHLEDRPFARGELER